MPEIKIVTEVAGRVCALPVEIGGTVSDGDEIAFVEAMKMEIPVTRRLQGKSRQYWSSSTTSSPKDRSSRSSTHKHTIILLVRDNLSAVVIGIQAGVRPCRPLPSPTTR